MQGEPLAWCLIDGLIDILQLIEARCLLSESFKFWFSWLDFKLALMILCDVSILKSPICFDVGVELWNSFV